MKGSAHLASFAAGKFAMRAVAQSLAREFGPRGIHVVHAIIDGMIDIENSKGYVLDHPEAKISPEAVSLSVYPKAVGRPLTLVRLPIHTGFCIPSRGLALLMSSTLDRRSKSGRALQRLLCRPAGGDGRHRGVRRQDLRSSSTYDDQ